MKCHLLAAVTLLSAATLIIGGVSSTAAQNKSVEQQSQIRGVEAVLPANESMKIKTWQDLKFGLFIHWGVFSNFGGVYNGKEQTIGYPEQIKAWMNIPDKDYLATAAKMKAEKFDAKQWCQMAKNAGMKYLVITSKHHDGFAMWNTKTTSYNVMKRTAFGRDPLKELSLACKKIGVKFGVYFSIIDWSRQIPEPDQNLNPIAENMMPYIHAQLKELMSNYGDITEVWFDMGKPTPDQSARMARWVHEIQPNAMVNSRVWNNKGDFEVGGDNTVESKIMLSPWEAARSVFPKCWGYCSSPKKANRDPQTLPMQITTNVKHLYSTLSGGGQYLLNVGPKGTGEVDKFDQAVLLGVGKWITRHSELMNSRPTLYPRQQWGNTTIKENAIFLGVTNFLGGQEIMQPGITNVVKSVKIDGSATVLKFRQEGTNLYIKLPSVNPDPNLFVIKVETEGNPRYLSEDLVRSNNGHFNLEKIKLHKIISPHATDQASKVLGWVAPISGEVTKAVVKVKGSGIIAQRKYQVKIGTQTKVVTGAELISGVGEFILKNNQANQLEISLYHPAYYADSLGIKFNAISVVGEVKQQKPTPAVSPGVPVVSPGVPAKALSGTSASSNIIKPVKLPRTGV